MKRNSKTYIAIPPGVTIKEMMGDQEISRRELALAIGESEAFVKDLLGGEASLTEEVAQRLEAVLGMERQFWLNLERLWREDLAKVQAENAQAVAARKAAREASERQSQEMTSPVLQSFAV